MDENRISKLKRFFAFLTGFAMMLVSMYFSNLGFGFGMDDPNLGTIGTVLAISITVIELVFNGQLAYSKKNLSIYAIGIFAYLYGISTNCMGFWMGQNLQINSFSDLTNFRAIFGAVMGIFLEVAPEPLLVFGLIGLSDKEGDMLGALLNTFEERKPEPQRQTNNAQQRKEIPYTPQHRPQENRNNGQPMRNPIPANFSGNRPNILQNGNRDGRNSKMPPQTTPPNYNRVIRDPRIDEDDDGRFAN